jgi:Secretion system C-terminal sorting domain
MRALIFFTGLILTTGNIIAQGISNVWMGGYSNASGAPPWGGWKMDFNSGVPIINYELRNMNFNMTCATISDSLGNFLFATNGVIVMNSVNDTMMNGTGLNPGVYSSPQWFGDGLRLPQAALILPLPDSPNLYYLFHMTLDTLGGAAAAYYFYFSLIDLNLDGGKGGVTLKNIVLLNGLFSPTGISACKHANGRDWWINIHDRLGTEFHFFLLSNNIISYDHSQTFGFREGIGTYSFSPDGSKIGGYNSTDDFEIFDFDRCSGMLSNYRQVAINDSMVWFGSAFSPNSKYLYGSSLHYLYQVDATSNQPDTSLTIVDVWDGTYYGSLEAEFGLPQLAPDGKIYITTGSVTPYIHMIEQPDSNGNACNVIQRHITLPSYNSATIPNHPNYFLGALIGSPCDTLGVGLYEAKNVALKIQPNPSDGYFQIVYPPHPENGTLEIVNVLGAKVYSVSLPPWSQLQNMDISHFGSGVYFVKIFWKNKSGIVKVLKN